MPCAGGAGTLLHLGPWSCLLCSTWAAASLIGSFVLMATSNCSQLSQQMAPGCRRAQTLLCLYNYISEDVKSLLNKLFYFPGILKLLGGLVQAVAGWDDCQGCSLHPWRSRAGRSLAAVRVHCPPCTHCGVKCRATPPGHLSLSVQPGHVTPGHLHSPRASSLELSVV